jgi:hypothetical protein
MDPISFLMELEKRIASMTQAERAHVALLLGNIAAMIRDVEPPK